MCGITGFASRHPVLSTMRFADMRDTLAHRGPDGSGLRMWNRQGAECAGGEEAAVGLAHRRLSIIDLSEAASQPMSNEDGSIWIAFNGEFYNFQDHRSGLESAGHVFRSRSDTETFLHLYEQYGVEPMLARANGMFALAIWNARERQMILARDRLGKKPLYYLLRPDGSLVFASEIKALVASGLVDRTRLDPVALAQCWTYGYTMGERTIYEQVRRLPPAHYAIWKDGQFSITEYWACPFGVEVRTEAKIDDLADELESLLCDAIRLRLISDVPLGLFLSGGIDSSLVAALAAKVAGKDLRTFTIAFEQKAYNEAPHAAAVAEHLGLKNEMLTVTDRMESYFEPIARQFDEPFGDSSSIPTYFVSKLARQHVTVALSGDGGDELFAGYRNYREGLRLWGTREQRAQFRKRVTGMGRIWDLKRRLLPADQRLLHWERALTGRMRRQVFSRTPDFHDTSSELRKWMDRVPKSDLLSQMQYLNLKTYLPDDIFVKVDRMSMAHSLECRSPLVDYRVVEFASRLPYEAKMDSAGQGKRLLRRLLKRYVPESMTDRPKQGFGMPFETYCQGATAESLRNRWAGLRTPYFRPGAAGALFPAEILPATSLQWFAFVTLLFFEGRS